MLKDGLWDVYGDVGMGVCAELCAENHSITREQQVRLYHFRLHEYVLSTASFHLILYCKQRFAANGILYDAYNTVVLILYRTTLQSKVLSVELLLKMPVPLHGRSLQ